MTLTYYVEHPGSYIREEMEARGWNQRDLAFIVGCNVEALNAIINGKRGISAEMAKALGDAFDVAPEFFANLQQAFEMAQAKNPYEGVAERRQMQTAYPIREMIQRGWITATNVTMLETQVARFFGLESIGDVPHMAHRAKKTRYDEIPAPQLAWLFRVKQLARAVPAPEYSENKLREALKTFETMLLAPEEARLVPKVLSECGVRFIVVEKLPNAGIDGVCFWLDEQSPVIGVSLQRDQIDNFWFVLRHECEHVLNRDGLHEEVIDESLGGNNASTDSSVPAQERKANAAAANFCAPALQMNDFMIRKKPYYYEKDVVAFARIHRRHPGLIVGQMQRRLDNYAYLTKYTAQVKIRHAVIPAAIADGWGQSIPLSL